MILKRTEYGTDGNIYELSISNGSEYKTQKMISTDVLQEIRAEIEALEDTYGHVSYDEDLYKGAWNDAIYRVLDIIDKHKPGSEE